MTQRHEQPVTDRRLNVNNEYLPVLAALLAADLCMQIDPSVLARLGNKSVKTCALKGCARGAYPPAWGASRECRDFGDSGLPVPGVLASRMMAAAQMSALAMNRWPLRRVPK